MFINLSNHPSANWQEKQIRAARVYGEIVDMPFPQVDPAADETQLNRLAAEYLERILAKRPKAVLVAGEFTFVFALADALLKEGITVLSSCSQRKTVETVNADQTITKTALFDFVQFRRYGYYQAEQRSTQSVNQ